MEIKDKATKDEAKEIVDLLKQLPTEEIKVAKGYLSALVDVQAIKNSPKAG